MKKILLILSGIMMITGMMAQVPQGITHQAVMRDSQNQPIVESPIGVRISILQGGVDGEAVYVETHNPISNANGLITYVIGQGAVESGVFTEIDWTAGPYFLKTEADPLGGTDYTITGITQFHSVPYALFAERVSGSISHNIQPPTVLALDADPIEEFSATINGIVNGEGFLTNVVFEWGTTPSYGNTVTAIPSPVTGTDDVQVSAVLSNLQAATTYHYRIKASNAVDIIYSEDMSFTTGASVPQLTTNPITSITPFSANSGGNITYDGGLSVTQRGVVWSTESNPTIDNHEGITSDGTGGGTFTSSITDLSPQTLYYVRAYATNDNGTAYGNQRTFTTLGQVPTATTLAASDITTTSAVLNGVVNPRHLSTTVVFEYGLTTEYGSTVTATQSPVEGNTNISVNAEITGLAPGVEYYFRVIAENELGVTYGVQRTFTTLGPAPTVVTQQATGVTTESAVLNASVNPNHLETTVIFEWGLTDDYGNEVVAEQSPIEGSTNVSVSALIDGLEPETTYHFRVKAENELGVSYGEERQFNTYGTVTDIDDNLYYTIIIGNQEWMAENLRVTRYNNEDDIPTGLSDEDWSSTTSGAYAIYPHEGGPWDDGPIEGINSDEEMVTAYGKLYNWYAVDDTRGLCPEGWSVPSDADWTALVNYVVSQGFPNSNVTNGAGNALKSCRQVGSPLGGECNTSTHPRWDPDGTHHGFDEFGFSALPGGYRNVNGNFFPLDDIYVYGGGNLVIYSNKNDDSWASGRNFYNTLDAGSSRSRNAQNDGTPYDPANPPAGAVNHNHPNITMFFSTAGLGAIEGTVTEDGEPLAGVNVHIMGTNMNATTNDDGFFEFPFVLPGTYDLHFTKFGYYDAMLEDVLVVEDETTVVTTEMESIPYYSIGLSGDWWSSSEYSSPNAWTRLLISSYGNVYRFNYNKRLGFSVRCVRDIDN